MHYTGHLNVFFFNATATTEIDTYLHTLPLHDALPICFVNTDNSIEPVSNIGTFSGPANGTAGWLRGGEFSTALSGDLFSDALSGFGLQFSTSYTDSSIAPEGPGSSQNLTLPGLYKWVASGPLYYEKSGFTARFCNLYRSTFRGELTSLFAHN